MYINKSRISTLLLLIAAVLGLNSCSDNKSYAELLNDENKAVNAYLANHCVVSEVPADSVFVTVAQAGERAPFYRMDPEGMVYMQVVRPGTPGNRAASDQLIYFRFTRYNIVHWYTNGQTDEAWVGDGNANDLEYASTSFRYGNYTLQSSAQYGSGIQLPLSYLPIDCEVNIVIKSQYGFTSEISNVVPFMYNVRYFPSQI